MESSGCVTCNEEFAAILHIRGVSIIMMIEIRSTPWLVILNA